jgi:hypothetical protein
MNILLEALLVGLALLPAFWVSEKVAGAYGKWVVVFVSGALFHLVAEFTGVNHAYVMTKL